MEAQKISVELEGVSDIMFDRFIDYSAEKRPPEQKLYLAENNVIVLPVENLNSFLFGQSPEGCAAVFEAKKRKDYFRVGQSHVFIKGTYLPFLDEKGKPIAFNGFTGQLYTNETAGRVKKGSLSIKQEAKKRPVLRLPWSLAFDIMLIKNNLIDETKLLNWFRSGGLLIAVGTFRPRFGRFRVTQWSVEDMDEA